MEDLDFNNGNNVKFIKEVEQIRSSIRSMTIEFKGANEDNLGNE